MLCFFIYCLSFLLLSKSFFMPMKKESGKVLRFLVSRCKQRSVYVSFFQESRILTAVKRILTAVKRVEILDEKQEITLLDLPDLDLECILEKLSPAGLCSMAGVCKNLREKCKSDHLWKKHMNQKWGRLIGDAAYTEWKCQIDHHSRRITGDSAMQKSPFQRFSCYLDNLFSNGSRMDDKATSSKKEDSIMSFYLALETGKFWFPAQVYNRENGHVGFMLSCYDAEVCYDSKSNNFVASFWSQGRRSIEENIEWKRLRPPPVDTPANVLHISDRLDELKPDDHIEIQWRRKKEFPYGWWYGVVGHLESCSGHQVNCMCHMSDKVILEFKQYIPGSQWRRAAIERKDHRQVGNEGGGFYGGIRKLYNKEEIEAWKHFWTNCLLE